MLHFKQCYFIYQSTHLTQGKNVLLEGTFSLTFLKWSVQAHSTMLLIDTYSGSWVFFFIYDIDYFSWPTKFLSYFFKIWQQEIFLIIQIDIVVQVVLVTMFHFFVDTFRLNKGFRFKFLESRSLLISTDTWLEVIMTEMLVWVFLCNNFMSIIWLTISYSKYMFCIHPTFYLHYLHPN